MSDPSPVELLDARGKKCPMPVIELARAVARSDAALTTLRVLADDPAARADIPAWCRLKGHSVQVQDRGDHTAYDVVVQRRSTAS